ncbi:unnamed protein product, partial [Prorocentrum cordatum]
DCADAGIPEDVGTPAPGASGSAACQEDQAWPPSTRTHLRGLVSYRVRGSFYHRANISVNRVELVTRCDRDLGVVLDFHMALLAVKQRMKDAQDSPTPFEQRFRETLGTVLVEGGLSSQSMGLRFCVRFWNAWVNTTLATPYTTDLDRLIRRGENGMNRKSCRCRSLVSGSWPGGARWRPYRGGRSSSATSSPSSRRARRRCRPTGCQCAMFTRGRGRRPGGLGSRWWRSSTPWRIKQSRRPRTEALLELWNTRRLVEEESGPSASPPSPCAGARRPRRGGWLA